MTSATLIHASVDSVKSTRYLLSDVADSIGSLETDNRPFYPSSGLQAPSLVFQKIVAADQTAYHWTHLFPFPSLFLGSILKGQPSPMSRKTLRNLSFNSPQKGAQCYPYDLAGFESGQLSQFVQNRPVFATQVNRRRTGSFVRRSQHPLHPIPTGSAIFSPLSHCYQSDGAAIAELEKIFDKLFIPYEKRVQFADFVRRLLRGERLLHVAQFSQWRRILDYLAWAESAELDAWLRDDLRIAWLTVSFAEQGYEQPHIAATQQVLGLHPDHVFAKIEERRELKLGRVEYEKFCTEESAKQFKRRCGAASLPEKKPPVSVGVQEQEKRA